MVVGVCCRCGCWFGYCCGTDGLSGCFAVLVEVVAIDYFFNTNNSGMNES